MFGMLDYRAHKLRWLLLLPVKLLQFLGICVLGFVAVMMARSTQYSVPVKIVIAYVGLEVTAAILLYLLWRPLGWVIDRVFFWLIDVVPARGADADEARGIVRFGRLFELEKKLCTQIEDWTPMDTREYVTLCTNWRARFFPVRERVERTVAELKHMYAVTGQRLKPEDKAKTMPEIHKRLGIAPKWLEKLIVPRQWFNSIIAFLVITLVMLASGGDI
jgi:hypothetical protein